MVDGVTWPTLVCPLWHLRPTDRLKGPVALAGGVAALRGGPRGPLVDPVPQQGHLLWGKSFALGGHALVRLRAGDALQESAVTGPVGHDGRPGVTPPEGIRL